MKMRKLLSLVAGIAVVASAFVTTASAAKNENPVASVSVVNVGMAGNVAKAVIAVSYDMDADPALVAYSEEFDMGTFSTVYKGKGIEAVQVTLKPNADIFDVSTITAAMTSVGKAGVDTAAGTYDVTFAATENKSWLLNDSFQMSMFTVDLKDSSITKEQLAAMPNIVDITAFTVRIKEYPAGCTTANGYEQTYYRLDGEGDFIPTVIEGAEVVEPDEPEVPDEPTVDDDKYGKEGNEFDGKASKYWTVDFDAWTGTAEVILTDGTTEKTINVTTAEGSEYDIAGAVSFYVYVIGDADEIANVYIAE